MSIVIGTANFGMPYGISKSRCNVPINEVKKILKYAQEQNVGTLDTAPAYGSSEAVLGELGIADWKIITKISIPSVRSENYEEFIFDQVKNSLSKLKVVELYGLLLHQPKSLLEHNGALILRALNSCKSAGLTKNIGISIYSPDDLDTVFKFGSVDIVQAPFNILDTRIVDSGWANTLKENNIELHARSIFLQGVLLKEMSELPEYFLKWNKLWSRWNDWLNLNQISAAKACFSFVNSVGAFDKIVVGVESKRQLEEIAELEPLHLTEFTEFRKFFCEELVDPRLWYGYD